ncbi:MAG: hypothetical protein MUC87_18850 [Bacteroidia bacterium]|jgi:hypothetical protein|nr:hypothetical protein [Bacteroidia bacterium]
MTIIPYNTAPDFEAATARWFRQAQPPRGNTAPDFEAATTAGYLRSKPYLSYTQQLNL